MSNVIALPKPTNGHTQRQEAIEATPYGINVSVLNDVGIYQHEKRVDYAEAICQLKRGQFDDALPDGLRFIAEIQQGDVEGWFSPTDEQRAIIWRWIIACLFISEQREKNGTVDIPNGDNGTDKAVIYSGQYGGIAVYPATERISLANHIEVSAIEEWGKAVGLARAVHLYQSMVEVNPDGGELHLSQWGRDSLTMLHDGFINMLNTDGMPASPIAH